MRFSSVSAILALVSVAVAQDLFDAIQTPDRDQVLPAGKPFDLVWNPAGVSGTATIQLLLGDTNTTLVGGDIIANSINNLDGKYSWTPKDEGKATYGWMIYLDSDHNKIQYSNPFQISADPKNPVTTTVKLSTGPSYTSTVSSSSSSSTSSTVSESTHSTTSLTTKANLVATSTSTKPTSSAAPTVISSSAAAVSANASSSAAAQTSAIVTATRPTAIVSGTGAGAGSSSTSTPSPLTSSAASSGKLASGGLMMGGLVLAFAL